MWECVYKEMPQDIIESSFYDILAFFSKILMIFFFAYSINYKIRPNKYNVYLSPEGLCGIDFNDSV